MALNVGAAFNQGVNLNQTNINNVLNVTKNVTNVIQQAARETENVNKATKSWAGNLDHIGNAFQAIQQMMANLPSLGSVADAVAKGAPGVFERWSRATRDLTGVMGQLFVPVLQLATGVVRGLADLVQNMDPTTRQLAVALTAAGVAATTTAALIIAGITAVSTAMAVLDVETAGIPVLIGAIVTGAAALAGALAATVGTTRQFSDAWGAVMHKLEPAIAFFGALGNILEQVFLGIADDVMTVMEPLSAVFDSLLESLGELAAALNLDSEVWRLVGVLLGTVIVPVVNLLVLGLTAMVYVLDQAAQSWTKLAAAVRAAAEVMKSGGAKSFTDEYTTALSNAFDAAAKLRNQQQTSFGAGGFQAHIEAGESYVRRAQELALQESVGRKDPQEETAKNTKGVYDLLSQYLPVFGQHGADAARAPKVVR